VYFYEQKTCYKADINLEQTFFVLSYISLTILYLIYLIILQVGFFKRQRRPEELEPLHLRYPEAYERPNAYQRKSSYLKENISEYDSE